MRILLKIFLFPITLVFSLMLLICEFICLFGTMLLSILVLLLFTLALGIIIFLGEAKEGIKVLVLAYTISPYGLPLLASRFIGELQVANERLKSI